MTTQHSHLSQLPVHAPAFFVLICMIALSFGFYSTQSQAANTASGIQNTASDIHAELDLDLPEDDTFFADEKSLFGSPNALTGNKNDARGTQADFLPVDKAYKLSLEFNQGSQQSNQGNHRPPKPLATAIWQIAGGYYLYRHSFKIKAWDQNRQPIEASLKIPKGKEKQDDYFGQVEVYYHSVAVDIELPSASKVTTHGVILAITSQGCADAGLCYPPETRYFTLDRKNQSVTAHHKTNPLDPNGSNASGASSSHSSSSSPFGDSSQFSIAHTPIWTIMLMAMLGGAILNLMPCVFPVLTLKVLSFAGKDPNSSHIKLHGLVYTAGVMMSFVAVAALMLALRASGEAIGWGFQLQNPWFIGALTYLFLIMSLSLAGFIELGSGLMGVGQNLASKDGYSGYFFTGVLAVVVASPCTAPFMGSALGYAITQPAYIALSVFAALGFGMALPFLLISLIPALAALMPKPGAWMDTMKRFLAFPLLATSIWLLWVAGKQTSANGMAIILLGCLALTLALWLWQEPVQKNMIRKINQGMAFGLAALSIYLLQSPWLQTSSALASDTHLAQQNGQSWQPFTTNRLSQLRQEGQAVFLNVTADWCITCLANEKATLSQNEVQQALKDNDIVYMKGDWTNYDPAITQLLTHYQRSGIPLYIYYPANGQPEVILPQILNVDMVLDTLKATL